jgi:hypothetical protein
MLDGGAIAVGIADDIVVGRRPRTGVIAALALGAALTIIAFTLR